MARSKTPLEPSTDLLSVDNETLRPLAERMRPRTLDDMVGQRRLLAPGSALRRAVESGRVHSMILWGPPGCGKTTLSLLLARYADAEFKAISAVLSGLPEVRQVLAEAAQRFVGAQTFQALSHLPVRTSLWDAQAEAAMGHLELARWAQQVVVAPATANTIARLACGLADDLVSTLCLATTAPIAIAPAMNHMMWRHPATVANVGTLRARGVAVIGPNDGPLAEGESGPGRMAEPAEIVAALAGRA